MRTLHRILLAGAALGFQASAQGHRAAPSKFLCDEGGFICVPAPIVGSVLRNPLRLPVYTNTSDYPELAWAIRDATGKLVDKGSTRERMDWDQDNPPAQHTFHILDFILTVADSDTGTMTITPTEYNTHGEAMPLPTLNFPVRLTTARSIVTTKEPVSAEVFKDEIYEYADSEHPRKPFRTTVPFKRVQMEVMQFDPNARIGMTAAAVIARNEGQAQWYVTNWSRRGDTAHVEIGGSSWAGAYHYGALLDYILHQSLLTIPGIQHVR